MAEEGLADTGRIESAGRRAIGVGHGADASASDEESAGEPLEGDAAVGDDGSLIRHRRHHGTGKVAGGRQYQMTMRQEEYMRK